MEETLKNEIDWCRQIIDLRFEQYFCAENDIGWYVRGLRSAADYAYEEANAQVNHLINPGLETVYLRADEAAISSSMVRELMRFGKPVGAYVPAPVARLLDRQD